MPILQYLSNQWNAALPGMADHLWQSTLFVAAAAVLALMLRRHSARIRYGIWLSASLKFLVPFSLLAAFGSRLAPRHIAAANTNFYLMENLTQPFSQPLSQLQTAVTTTTHSANAIHWKALLLAVWLLGFVFVLLVWIARWARLAGARRTAIQVFEGREISALRRLESTTCARKALDLLLSSTPIEPGVFGIFRPVLLWPKFVSLHLDDSQLDAILAHELCHVRRRDNLAAFFNMLIESIFWFHPLVWWMGARLIEERERACDEAVLEMGSRRQTYAESILKVCEFCLSSPLTCVSGVTGADLKKRMVHIMTDRIVPKLNFSRKFLLWTAACLALALPIVYGLFNPIPGHAESALGTASKYVDVSVKPHSEEPDGLNRTRVMISLKDASFMARGVPVRSLVQLAYRVQDSQVVQAPDWLGSAKYDVDAKVDNAVADQWGKLTEDQRGALAQQMLQELLADQFKLKVHQEAMDLPAYQLSIAESGSKLQKMPNDTHGMMQLGAGELTSHGTPLELLTEQLSMRLGRPIVDKTGLTGKYAYSLHWTPDADEHARMQQKEPIAADSPATEASGPPLLTAIQEQLGLTLQPVTTRVQMLRHRSC